MSSQATEMMVLLQELALLKELDAKYERGPRGEAETAEFEKRKRRRQEINDQIVILGKTVT